MANSKNPTNPTEMSLDPPARRRLPPLLRRAWYGLNQAFRRRIAHTGATPDQFTVMRSLLEGDAKGVTQCELTHIMSSDPNTIASLLERMESAGWLERKRHERDKRAYRIPLKPPRKRKRAKRIIAWTAGALAVLLVVLGGYAAYSYFPFVGGVTHVNVINRFSRMLNPGLLQMVPNKWSTVRSKYGSPSMLGMSQP